MEISNPNRGVQTDYLSWEDGSRRQGNGPGNQEGRVPDSYTKRAWCDACTLPSGGLTVFKGLEQILAPPFFLDFPHSELGQTPLGLTDERPRFLAWEVSIADRVSGSPNTSQWTNPRTSQVSANGNFISSPNENSIIDCCDHKNGIFHKVLLNKNRSMWKMWILSSPLCFFL